MAESLSTVKISARRCEACPLWANATQTVFGEGPPCAGVMLVGEQPGDREDLFVGPAGRMLERALAKAGLEREELYLTNAVKHFKNEPRGKRRIHKKPSDAEIDACHRWLERELELVAPRLVVSLGATAARARARARRRRAGAHYSAPVLAVTATAGVTRRRLTAVSWLT